MDNIQRKLLIKKDKNANQIVNFSSLVDETSIIFSGNENDDFITETLAKIYKEQGHYNKAIDAFEKLILKFPEKNTLFASQISEIKKIK